MYRKKLRDLLLQQPLSIRHIAELMEIPIRDVASDVEHLSKSLKRTEYTLKIEPAQCRKCGFRFRKNKMTKPGKCPRCQGTWIHHPLLHIDPR